MHAVLVWSHVAFMMVAFGAAPLGRLALRFLLASPQAPQSAQAIAARFAAIFRTGGLSVTAGVAIGAALVIQAGATGLTQTWIAASAALITLAGLSGIAIEDRWLGRLRRAEPHAVTAILREKIPSIAALTSPVIWLLILWLMIEKPT